MTGLGGGGNASRKMGTESEILDLLQSPASLVESNSPLQGCLWRVRVLVGRG